MTRDGLVLKWELRGKAELDGIADCLIRRNSAVKQETKDYYQEKIAWHGSRARLAFKMVRKLRSM